MENLNLIVHGMHSAVCAQKIEKLLTATRGVLSISINFSTKDTIITYDEKVIDEKTILKKIEKLNYRTEKKVLEDELQKKLKKTFNIRLKKLIIGLSLLLFLLIASRFLFPSLSWIPRYLNNPLLFLLTAVIFYISGFSIIKDILKDPAGIKNSKFFLSATGLAILFVYSLALTIMPFITPEISRVFLYETIAVTTVLIAASNIENIRAEEKLSAGILKLSALQPKKARVIRHEAETETDISNIKTGDIIKVKPGEAIPSDGIVIKGTTFINESIIAGGDLQAEKNIGDEVISGTINSKNTIIIKVTQSAKSNTLSQIINILEQTNKYKGSMQKKCIFAVPVLSVAILVFALLIGLFWPIYYNSLFLGVITAFTILLISNPFVFIDGIKNPFNYGVEKIAKQGIIFKGSNVLETACKIKRIVFNKTGVLTKGVPEITNIISKEAFNEKRFLILTGSVENASTHRFAEAIIKYCKLKYISFKKVYDYKYREGEGIIGTVDGQEVIAGNMKLLKKSNVQMNDELLHKAEILSKNVRSPVYVARNRELIGLIGIADTIKENAKEVISTLRKNDYQITIFTGDNEGITRHIAEELRVKDFIADMLQKEKIEALQNFQDKNEKVAFVGDGLNDAPILAQADLGIALGTGTDTNLSASDISIVSSNLDNIPKAFSSAEEINKTVKQNIYATAIYHLIALATATGLITFYTANIFMHPLLAPLLSGGIYFAVFKNTFRLRKNLP